MKFSTGLPASLLVISGCFLAPVWGQDGEPQPKETPKQEASKKEASTQETHLEPASPDTASAAAAPEDAMNSPVNSAADTTATTSENQESQEKNQAEVPPPDSAVADTGSPGVPSGLPSDISADTVAADTAESSEAPDTSSPEASAPDTLTGDTLAADSIETPGSSMGMRDADTVFNDSARPGAAGRAADSTAMDTAAVQQSVPADSEYTEEEEPEPATAQPGKTRETDKRENVFQSTRINTIDEMKGRYKSPKKALFMSLVLPGLGQAYVGHYIRGAAYLVLEGGLIWGWKHFVIDKHRQQVNRYRAFADEYWSHEKYERAIEEVQVQILTSQSPDYDARSIAMPTREAFCESVFGGDATSSSRVAQCELLMDEEDPIKEYSDLSHYGFALDEPGVCSDGRNCDPIDSDVADSIGDYRKNYDDLHDFYELIGKHQEYITGWRDADHSFDSTFSGESDRRDEYRKMRQKATDYSRMQAWFLGGIVLNHIVSSLDAALSARFHNKKLYQTDMSWYDRIRLDSYVALLPGNVTTVVQARLSF